METIEVRRRYAIWTSRRRRRGAGGQRHEGAAEELEAEVVKLDKRVRSLGG